MYFNLGLLRLMLIQLPGLPDVKSVDARKPENDDLIAPTLLPPRAIQQLVVRFPLEGRPLRYKSYTPFKLSFTTIGSSGKLQKSEIEVGVIITETDKSFFPPSPLAEPRRIRQ